MEFLKLSVVKDTGFCLNFQSVMDWTFIQLISISHRINCETVIIAYKSQHDLSLGLLLRPHLPFSETALSLPSKHIGITVFWTCKSILSPRTLALALLPLRNILSLNIHPWLTLQWKAFPDKPIQKSLKKLP